MDDPLDSQGVQRNFLNGQPWSDKYRSLAATWSRLPVYAPDKVAELTDALDKSKVVLLTSGTGSGKTVIVPKLALKYAMANLDTQRCVVVTTPKTFTTKSNAVYAAACLDVELGSEVGYAFRGSKNISEGVTRLAYMTDGYLLNKVRNDDTLSRYSIVIIDEAHERQVATDILLYRLRLALGQRPDLKAIIMSATIDTAMYSEYFESSNISTSLVHVSGVPNQTVHRFYLQSGQSIKKSANSKKLFDTGMQHVADLLSKGDSSVNILFFVPTTKDVLQGCEMFRKHVCAKANVTVKASCDACDCRKLFGTMERSAQDAVLQPATAPMTWKLIISTNVAESSVTFDDLDVVIDSGLEVSVSWLPMQHAYSITKCYTTQSQVLQRVGRVGRTKPGRVYHMYTQRQFESFAQYPAPTVSKVDLTDELLAMLNSPAMDLDKAREQCSQWLTPPTRQQLHGATHFLKHHGFLDGASKRLTKLGQQVQDMSVRCKLSTFNVLWILAGLLVDKKATGLKLAALMDVIDGDPNAIDNITERWDKDTKTKLKQMHPSSDHLHAVSVYDHALGMRGSYHPLIRNARTRLKELERVQLPELDLKGYKPYQQYQSNDNADIDVVMLARHYHAFDAKTKKTLFTPTAVGPLEVPIKVTMDLGTCETLVESGGKMQCRLVTGVGFKTTAQRRWWNRSRTSVPKSRSSKRGQKQTQATHRRPSPQTSPRDQSRSTTR